MQGIDATFDEVAFDGERDQQRLLSQFVLIAAAVASVGCVSVLALHAYLAAKPAAPQFIAPPLTPVVSASVRQPAPPKQMTAADFGPMIIEPGWLPAKPPTPEPSVASLEAAPSADNAQGAGSVPPTTATRLPDVVPLPPMRDVPDVADAFPMPPPRPPGMNAVAPEREAPPSVVASAPAPAGGGNVFQRFIGALSRPAESVAPGGPQQSTRVIAPPAPVAPAAPAVASAPAEPRSGNGRSGPSLFGFFSQRPGSSGPPAGYDRYTAVYDISARTVYMPDGSRLEAHSGLGDRLDDPRYVSERAKGATPPHLYELTMRESLFHGVQALRLNPVGDGEVYGRAGFLAHPYMLGPNGDSNGCVSVKDYATFLRAYQSGEIKRLAVVARL